MSELERLRDRVEQLEEALGLKLHLPNEFRLSPIEMKIVGILVRREIANAEMMFSGVYGNLPECDQPELKTIDVHLCNIRRKLAKKGYVIKNRKGVGFYFEGNARRALKNLCEAQPIFTLSRQALSA